MKAMIEAGAAGVRFDDQLPAGSTRAHPGQRVLIPTGQHIEALTAARLAADVLGVPSLVIARTGARAASLLTSDSDERDHEFLTGERTAEGLHRVEPGLYARSRSRPTPTCSGWRPRRRTSRRPARSPPSSTRSTRASCSPTAARRRSAGKRPRTTRRPRGSGRSWPRWGTASRSPPRLPSPPTGPAGPRAMRCLSTPSRGGRRRARGDDAGDGWNMPPFSWLLMPPGPVPFG